VIKTFLYDITKNPGKHEEISIDDKRI